MEETCKALKLGISDYFRKNNFRKAVIGLSGGIDSSVSAHLAFSALGRTNVTGILMPDSKVTSDEGMKDAARLADTLGIGRRTVRIDEGIEFFMSIRRKIFSGSKMGKNFLDYSIGNAKARMRMSILYFYANMNNALVIGTSDKSEIALGYTTKYGDSAADIMVIGDLWKTQALQMAKFLGLPRSILNRKPSAELVSGLDAEKELGADYGLLDGILKLHIEGRLSAGEICNNGFDKKIVKRVLERVRMNEHKRRSAVVIRLSEHSFHGLEWRMPITNGFKEFL